MDTSDRITNWAEESFQYGYQHARYPRQLIADYNRSVDGDRPGADWAMAIRSSISVSSIQ